MKRFIACILSVMILLTGCGNDTPAQPIEQTPAQSAEPTPAQTAEPTPAPEQAEPVADTVTTEAEPTTQAEDSIACEGKYREFLLGEEVVFFDEQEDGDLSYIFDEYVEEENRLNYSKGYTLAEVVDAMQKAVCSPDERKIESCGYYTVDIGCDGEEELCVELYDISAVDWCKISMVIKEFDGELRCVYTFLEMSRWYRNITYDGVIEMAGSGGADCHYYGQSYLDAQGKYHFLYEEEFDGVYFLDDYKVKELGGGLQAGLAELDDVYVNTDIVTFTEEEPYEAMIGVYAMDSDMTEEIAADDPKMEEILKIYSDAGITVSTDEEIEQAINRHCLDRGITEEMRNSADKIQRHVLYAKEQ